MARVKTIFSKYKKFGDYHWRFYEKKTAYFYHAEKIREWVKEQKVLDVGAGDGLITHLVGAIGIDNSQDGVDIAKSKGVHVIMGDAYDLPFSDDEFEAVMMIDVLEHFEFPDKALSEAKRVAPVLYIATPIKDAEPGKMDVHHYKEWSPLELISYLASQGYRIEGHATFKSKTQYSKFVRI